MRKFRILFFAPLLMAFQCEEDIDFSEDAFVDTGLTGRWELAAESIDGISDLAVKCCRFFEFNPDENPDDLKGVYLYEDETGFYQGVITVDPENGTILFEREGMDPVDYAYDLNDPRDYLSFTFTENEAEFSQGWKRIY